MKITDSRSSKGIGDIPRPSLAGNGSSMFKYILAAVGLVAIPVVFLISTTWLPPESPLRAKMHRAQSDAAQFEAAINQFHKTYGYYPVSNILGADPAQIYQQAFEVLTANPNNPLTDKLNPQHQVFYAGESNDPYGKPYHLKIEPEVNPTNVVVYSTGPEGK
jgi:hypothetical protein